MILVVCYLTENVFGDLHFILLFSKQANEFEEWWTGLF